ncbi:methionine--tRNA ligase [Capnocytophaga gingivalis]|uniref:methionine--tRNA ligase n=1 Tax=Capnocytophaga gingivalis TaxID=1017 RepID=UPI0028D09CB8|nr:methionine--tRNA ligase [Capnocytophaga gingivalis]
MSERYTITAALPYTNGPIHIGHLAGVYVPADIFARYQRLKNNDVAFICGSDEHGVAISIKAKKEGTTPQEIIDKYNKIIKDSLFDFGISFDNYSRTSLPIHYQTASEFFRTLYDKGDFIEETSEQLYDEQAGQFLADRFVIGTCPKCGNEEAYGDQCERCGTSLNATDLINPKSTLTGSKPVLRQTKHWFLPLQDYTEFLEKWIIEGHKNDWKPNVYGQVKSWIDDGLRPRAVTRDLDWGIPVPVEGAEGKVLYVWFDAPIGYISSTKEWAAREGKDWEPYWKDKKTKLIHFIGKDNIVFHCIIFPAMLKAEGSYILPENVPANEFLNLEGNKLSTSKNWAVWLNEYLEEFPSQQDTLRYVITANAPETKDNDFTWKDFQARNNNELVAIYGNFINRVMVLTDKYYKGVVPSVGELTQVDREVFAQIKELIQKIEQSLERYRFREAQQELMNIARLGNKYLADEEPWKLIKEDPKRVETIMYIALHIATALAVTSEPFLPFTSEKLKRMLNFSTMEKAPTWQDIPLSDRLIPQGHTIGESVLLFEKIEDEAIEKQIAKLEKSKQANKQAITNDHTTVVPQKELISYEDFAKMDIRIGTILEAEKMPKADKLLILKVDTGIDQRTIVSGIAQSFDNKEIIGKKVTVLANLAPRKLRGVESHGMILMVENSAGKYVFLNPDAEGIANGTEVK